MTAPYRKRLLEELIPLAEIGKESSKSIAYGDIHAINTWYARRPLAACRAATFAALVDAPSTEAERDSLTELIVRSLPGTLPVDVPSVIEEMRRRVRESYSGGIPRVLDPFAGGGSLPLEAARLGCEAHALDLNPVALLTMLGTVDFPIRLANARIPLPAAPERQLVLDIDSRETGDLAEAVAKWGGWVLKEVRPLLERFYPQERGSRFAVAYHWAKSVRCPNPSCQAEIPLVAHRWLRTKGPTGLNRAVAFRLVPQLSRQLRVEILEGQEAEDDNPSRGTMASGSAVCPFCPQTISPAEVKAQFADGRSGRILLTVISRSEEKSGTEFRPATPADMDAFRDAELALREMEAAHDDPFLSLIPDEPFPERARSIDLGRYGTRTWGQLHNSRQALSLTAFVRGIRDAHREMRRHGATEESARAVTLYLAFTLTGMVVRMSEVSRWYDRKIQKATEGHRLPMLWDYAEANPLSGSTGSWESSLKSVLPAIRRLLGAAPSPAQVRWGDATSLQYPDESFDAVLTDPPYYDSVCYSDLSDMQYVWLHRALGDILPEYFPAPLTPKKAEIIEEQARHGSAVEAKAFFEERLRTALAEMRRVLKPDGIALVMYAHTATSAWETLVGALIGAGFQVTASWPVNTETSARRDWLGGAVLSATIFLVCRKRAGHSVGYLDEVLPEMREVVRLALSRFWAVGIGGADFFISAIGPALSVYSRFGEVRYASGQTVSVSSFLTLVRRAVVDYSLERALAGVDVGDVDRETQFALLWRWTYGHQQVETGAALLLDKATGVELSELERQGLVARVDGAKKMVLLGVQDRPDVVSKTLRQVYAGHAVWLVDVVYSAALLWRDNRREELSELLAVQDDTMRMVAQALADLETESSDERRLILGFLGSWSYVPESKTASDRPEQLQLGL